MVKGGGREGGREEGEKQSQRRREGGREGEAEGGRGRALEAARALSALSRGAASARAR